MIKLIKYILIGLFFYTSNSYAQSFGYVKGTVTDKSNDEILPGALVTLNKTKGVAADINGVFVISAVAGEYNLACDLLGYTKFTSNIMVKAFDTVFVNIQLGNGNQCII